VMLGESARPADRELLRHSLGLDQPVQVQLVQFYQNLLRGDLGQSLHSQRPIADMIGERIGSTAILAGAALLCAILIAVPLGMLAAVKKDTWADYGAMGFSLLGVSIPNFWLGPMLILVFALHLGWVPVSGSDSWTALILPAVTLGTSMAAILSRMVRSSMLEVMGEDHIRTARAKGLSTGRILLHHALRNAMLPVLTILGLQLGVLLGGAVITETIFAWPGIGSLLVDSIMRRDYPVVQGCVLLIALIYVTVNTLTDILYAQVDPRVTLK